MTTITPLAIPEVLLITPKRHGDARGWFAETWSRATFANAGLETTFVQDNQAFNAKAGTVRGLHFQQAPHPQAKLVRVLKGAIFDVAVDVRQGSKTFGQWVGAELTAEKGEQAVQTSVTTIDGLSRHDYDLDRWLAGLGMTLTWRGA